MLVVWSGDIFAYFVGKTFGRHKMAPRISPGKTWEGAAASMFASVGVGLLLSLFWGQKIPPLFQNYQAFVSWGMSSPILAVSALLNIAAQLGDLVESAIKRGAGVKDSGAILPGHGGMLDRIDALLFAAPVLWISVAGRILLFP
jgi:phosphatidate cytidylyltransferase